jgi:subtilisin family serine protease
MPTSSIEDTLSAIGYAKVIVALKPTATAAAAETTRVEAESAIENHFIIPSGTQAESLALSARLSASRSFSPAEPVTSRRVRVYPKLGLAIGYINAAGLAGLEADASVGKVVKAPELSLIRPVEAQDAKLATATSWGIERLNVRRLWEAGFTGEGVIVGHLDTGVDGAHPALKGAIVSFAEFDMAGDKVPNAKPTDSGEHGTHTAGTIVGRAGQKGAFGVAPGAKLASAMVIEGGQVIDRILAGMDWIIGEGARIMSMSLGLRGFTPAFQTVIDALRAANVLPVIAVGNEGPNSSRSPGNYDSVLSVGAMDVNNKIPDFSSSQQFDRPKDPLTPDVVAPGVNILSCVPKGKYKIMDGTSMATPHIAGLAALLLQAKPAATLDELEQAILNACSRPAGMPEARANHGVPDAAKAFAILTGSALPAAAAVAPRPRITAKTARGKKPARGKSKQGAKRSARAKVAGKGKKAAAARRKKA